MKAFISLAFLLARSPAGSPQTKLGTVLLEGFGIAVRIQIVRNGQGGEEGVQIKEGETWVTEVSAGFPDTWVASGTPSRLDGWNG